MKKILLIVLLLFTALSVYCQDEVSDADPLSVGGGVGTVIIGDETYMRFRLNPELTLGKLGVGLDIDLLITEDGGVREEDWDDWQDYVHKLYYVRWSKRGDTFYSKLGAFGSYQLGRGLVFSDYTNTLNYPQERQLGLQVGGRIENLMDLELEGFTSNITNPTILGARASIAPLHNSGIPFLDKARVGMTIGYDMDQYEGITEDEEEIIINTVDTDGDGDPDVEDFDPDGDGKFTVDNLAEMGFSEYQIAVMEEEGGFIDDYENLDEPLDELEENELLVWGIDYELPLVNTDMLQVGHYGELSQIADHGYGFIFPGFYTQFLIFNLNLEYRQYDEDYLAGYFDHYYDQDRAFLQYSDYEEEYNIFVKEDMLAGTVASRGWYGKLRADLFDVLYLEAGYTDMYADDSDDGLKSLVGTLGVNTSVIPKLKNMEFKYYQLDVEKITNIIAPRVVIRGTLRYELAEGTNLLWEYQERYNDINGDGEIEGDEETERNVSMGVEFRF